MNLHLNRRSWVQIPPLRPLKSNDLHGQRSKPVTNQTPSEAQKAREVMDLIRGLAAEKTVNFCAKEPCYDVLRGWAGLR